MERWRCLEQGWPERFVEGKVIRHSWRVLWASQCHFIVKCSDPPKVMSSIAFALYGSWDILLERKIPMCVSHCQRLGPARPIYSGTFIYSFFPPLSQMVGSQFTATPVLTPPPSSSSSSYSSPFSSSNETNILILILHQSISKQSSIILLLITYRTQSDGFALEDEHF